MSLVAVFKIKLKLKWKWWISCLFALSPEQKDINTAFYLFIYRNLYHHGNTKHCYCPLQVFLQPCIQPYFLIHINSQPDVCLLNEKMNVDSFAPVPHDVFQGGTIKRKFSVFPSRLEYFLSRHLNRHLPPRPEDCLHFVSKQLSWLSLQRHVKNVNWNGSALSHVALSFEIHSLWSGVLGGKR